MDLFSCIYLLLIFLVLYVFTSHLLDKVQNHPPTPFLSLPVIGHLYLLRKPFYQRLSRISEQYGPVVFLRFGSRPTLLVSSPSAAEECFTKNDVTFANRPHFLVGKIFGSNFTSLVWAPHGDHWRNLRRISSIELLSSHQLHTHSHIRASEVRELITNLKMSFGQPVDLRSAFFEFTYNVLMRMIGGKRYYGNDVEHTEEARRFQKMVRDVVQVGGVSLGDFIPFTNWFRLNRGMEMKLMALQVERHQIMQNLIKDHRETKSSDFLSVDDCKKKNMIQILLSLQESDPQYYTDDTIRSLMLVLFQAGTDTSLGIMEWAMSHLLNCPEILQTAHQEIDNLVGENRLIDDSDLSELPYLCGIINETLRIHPPFPILLPHESSQECIVGGYRIPRGTTLLVNIWAIQNDPNLWVDPEKFNPERFVGVDKLKSVGNKFMPFGSGRRKCPGEGLAIRMLGLVVGSLIQCFDWERETSEMVDMAEGTAATVSKVKPLVAKCRPRPTMGKLLSQFVSDTDTSANLKESE